jgi:long-chain acyl-CoA synthetase
LTPVLADLLVAALTDSNPRVAAPDGAAWRSSEILALARRTADALAAHGVHPAEPVHVIIGNRPEDLGVLLGVWLAGAVAVPVHQTTPPKAVSGLRQITQTRFAINAGVPTTIADAPPANRDLLGDAALVLFTSGSTGLAKAVVVGHASLAGKLAVLARLLNLRPDDLVILPLQLTFIFGIWVGLLALLAGARIILVPRFSPEVVDQELARGGTVLAAVPSMLRMLMLARAHAAPALRAILAGGEPLGTALPVATNATWPGAGIFDLYGLTETGSCDFCLTPADLPHGIGTIGFPTGRVSFRVAAEDGAAAAPGQPGELQIRTPFGMLGYLDQPDLTKAAFSDGFFRTGDVARVRTDGRVEIVGRIKEIISRGGNKIAPLEIENLFGNHPDIIGALCAGIPDKRLGEAVHVMLVPRPGAALHADELRRWAAERIERYKLPDGIHLAQKLPVGPTGKADRAALASMVIRRQAAAEDG